MMTINLDQKIEYWRKQLLDLGRRNRLIHFPNSNLSVRISRVALAIQKPDPQALWKLFAEDEKSLVFPLPPVEDSLDNHQ
ncbi:MAG: DUF4011 domain-containing protein, partial [Coriobacteriales bacterium]|nr:DUF4011 domain-containing protein [Coriobacteriales bacterium]